MNTKTCSRCGELKSESLFFRDRSRKDGLTCWCKRCCEDDRRSRRERDPQRFKEIEKRRRERQKLATDFPEKRRRWDRNWRDRNPMREEVYNTVHSALLRGELAKPEACSCCGATGVTIDGHHEDYSKPLDVMWLCKSCHKKLHRKKENPHD